ncbi:MAG TPA: response regulator [Verrucomicrobiota bacterium]|nr:response regulator [Verrucomicrobiota bacterium]
MKSIRMLIVEDEPALLELLKRSYREKFKAQGFDSVTIEESRSVEDARKLAKGATSNPYDFVSLDVNLGDTTLTGLDVLSTIKRYHSAWMVALLTGVETDTSVDKIMGKAAGIALRQRLRRDAYARFPAERLLVVEKPSRSLTPKEAEGLLGDRLEQIAAVYEEVGRLRYIFRPIEVICLQRVKVSKGQKPTKKFIETASTQWQIRFNCGDIRTLPDKAGFRTLHRLLCLDRAESLTPEAALVAEPAVEKGQPQEASSADPVAAFFQAKGIDWNSLDADKRDQLVRGALSVKFVKFQELRGLQDEDDLSPNEEDELKGIIHELGPLAEAAETAYDRMRSQVDDFSHKATSLTTGDLAQNDLHVGHGSYDQVGDNRRGQDSPEAALFRARMKRVKDCLRENGFAQFADHLDDYVQSTGANWSYNPPTDVEWTTSA